MFNDILFKKFRIAATSYCVYVFRGDEYMLDYPQMFEEYDDAVTFLKETYGTDAKPLTEGQCHWFRDSNGNRFFIGIVNTYGRR